MQDILFLTAPVSHPSAKAAARAISIPPMGIAYMASVLREDGFEVGCLDFFLQETTAQDLKDTLALEQPRIIGISAATQSINNALRLARFCKATLPEVTVVLGGPHVTFLDRETLEQEKCVDVVVRNEGEYTMLELANHILRSHKTLDAIRGITYRQDRRIVRNRPRPLIGSLDQLPFPARDLFDPEDYYTPFGLVASRGCPGKCIFCAAGAMAGGRYRMRSADDIVSEVVHLKGLGAGRKFVHFTDDTLTADVRRLRRFCDLMTDLRVSVRWVAESRVDVISRELVQDMIEAGCVGIQFGVESGSQATLDRIGKKITVEQVVQAVALTSELGLDTLCSMMLGLPGETKADIQHSIDFAIRLQEEYEVQVLFSIATPLPGTYMYNHRDELEMTLISEDWDDYHFYNPVFTTPYLTAQEARNLHYEAMTRLIASVPERVARARKPRADAIQVA
jgi:anaerobic magnesium-protoporphyrin IX monomethyl ester cyclase